MGKIVQSGEKSKAANAKNRKNLLTNNLLDIDTLIKIKLQLWLDIHLNLALIMANFYSNSDMAKWRLFPLCISTRYS